ncbi:transcriptional adapter 1 [Lingula anatina]|uniref:Transcriptional adapter 1 n=1 Tax=Lingula anatina TaxID=7574 RepID=A0A1S3KEG5_LINAN|nr:transcriptional adapter 1 [Lingula anatina]|eukprot:XP_013420892.1 transcriptional adapter 1 [Lingula anatina]
MAASAELNVARKKLAEALGDSITLYFHNLRSWFKQKMSREDFDLEARRLLTREAVHLHNEFLLAILTRCQTYSSMLMPRDLNCSSLTYTPAVKALRKESHKIKSKKAKTTRSAFVQRFQPASPLNYSSVVLPGPPEEEGAISFCTREMMLPDIGMVHGRMLVMAWDQGLEDVKDDAVRLVMQAVEHQLKCVLTAVFSQRNGFQMRERRFKHAMGTQAPQDNIRNSESLHEHISGSAPTAVSSKGTHIPSMKRSLELGAAGASLQLSCGGSESPAKSPVSLYELMASLEVK